MLDADARDAILEAGHQLTGEVARSLAGEEAHDVRALEVGHRVSGEAGRESGEGAGIAEHDVAGPLGLVGRPVIALRPGLEDLLVQWVDPVRDRRQSQWPIDVELFVGQSVGPVPGRPIAVKQFS